MKAISGLAGIATRLRGHAIMVVETGSTVPKKFHAGGESRLICEGLQPAWEREKTAVEASGQARKDVLRSAGDQESRFVKPATCDDCNSIPY
jgi:formate dehydrogenase maturation protein FdhE